MTDKTKCKSKIVFGDDFGDNEATFRCQLAHGHNGLHEESGSLYGDSQNFKVTWEWPKQQPLENCVQRAQGEIDFVESECKLIDKCYNDKKEAEIKKQQERAMARQMLGLIEKSKLLGDKFDSNDFDDEFENIMNRLFEHGNPSQT